MEIVVNRYTLEYDVNAYGHFAEWFRQTQSISHSVE